MARAETAATVAGGAITAMRASYCRRASATGSVCVAGTPAPRSSKAWICGLTGIVLSALAATSGGELDAERLQVGRDALGEQADLAQVAYQAVMQIAAEELAEGGLVA